MQHEHSYETGSWFLTMTEQDVAHTECERARAGGWRAVQVWQLLSVNKTTSAWEHCCRRAMTQRGKEDTTLAEERSDRQERLPGGNVRLCRICCRLMLARQAIIHVRMMGKKAAARQGKERKGRVLSCSKPTRCRKERSKGNGGSDVKPHL
jgi:hypothetical protein